MTIDLGSLQRVACDWLPVLLDAAVKGAVLLMAAGTLVLAMRKASAAARQVVWLLTLAALLTLPLVSAALPSWQVLPGWAKIQMPTGPSVPSSTDSAGPRTEAAPLPELPISPASSGESPSELPADVPPAPAGAYRLAPQAAPAPTNVPAATTDAAIAGNSWRTWLVPAVVACWLTGTLVCLLPLALGRVSLWRLARGSRRIDAGPWAMLAQRAAQAVGLRGRIGILQSDIEPMPMVWGVLKPKLLLPTEAEEWSADRRWVVLLHELAHAKRHDCLAKFVAHVACAFYWFNPLCWVAFKLMQREAEVACDDLVLAAGHRPSDYAQHLLEIASGLKSGMLAAYSSIALARPNKLESRLLAILDSGRNRRAMTRVGALAAVILAAAVAVPLSVLQASGQPATAPQTASQPTVTPATQPASAPTTQPLELVRSIPTLSDQDAGIKSLNISATVRMGEVTMGIRAVYQAPDRRALWITDPVSGVPLMLLADHKVLLYDAVNRSVTVGPSTQIPSFRLQQVGEDMKLDFTGIDPAKDSQPAMLLDLASVLGKAGNVISTSPQANGGTVVEATSARGNIVRAVLEAGAAYPCRQFTLISKDRESTPLQLQIEVNKPVPASLLSMPDLTVLASRIEVKQVSSASTDSTIDKMQSFLQAAQGALIARMALNSAEDRRKVERALGGPIDWNAVREFDGKVVAAFREAMGTTQPASQPATQPAVPEAATSPADVPTPEAQSPMAREETRRAALAATRNMPRIAVYLVTNTNDTRLAEKAALNELELAKEPILQDKDFTSYDPDTQSLSVSAEATMRFTGTPSVWGTPYVVVVEGRRWFLGSYIPLESSYRPNVPVAEEAPLTKTLKLRVARAEDIADDAFRTRATDILKAIGRQPATQPASQPTVATRALQLDQPIPLHLAGSARDGTDGVLKLNTITFGRQGEWLVADIDATMLSGPKGSWQVTAFALDAAGHGVGQASAVLENSGHIFGVPLVHEGHFVLYCGKGILSQARQFQVTLHTPPPDVAATVELKPRPKEPATQAAATSTTSATQATHRIGIHIVTSPDTVGRARGRLMADLTLATEPPLISQDDIRQYDWQTHTIHLKPGVMQRISGRNPPRLTEPFVVVVDGRRLYVGMLANPLSSEGYRGVPVITVWPTTAPSADTAQSQPQDTIIIGPPRDREGYDPRNNETLKQALQDIGLLKDSDIPALPTTPPAAKATATGGFVVDKVLDVKASLLRPAIPPVRTEAFEVMSASQLTFSHKNELVQATLEVRYLSWPKATYVATLELLDPAGKVLASVKASVQASGEIITQPMWSQTELVFPLGTSEYLSPAATWRLTLER